MEETRRIALVRVQGATLRVAAMGVMVVRPAEISVRASVSCWADSFGGRPMRLPRRRAAAIPSTVRLRSVSRSYCAMAATIV